MLPDNCRHIDRGRASDVAAQHQGASSGHRVVDVVTLRSGQSLRGGIAWQNPGGTLGMVVPADWYRTANPAKAAAAVSEAIELRRTAWTQARDRITDRLKTAEQAPRLRFFLKQELERIEQRLADANPFEPEFLWFDIPGGMIAKIVRATPDEQRIALIFAWDQRLPNVATRDAGSLKQELVKAGVDLKAAPPDLSDRFPPRPQDDQEWLSRLALVEYGLDQPLDFQGMGTTLVRVREGQPANLADVLPKVLQQQLGSLLKDLQVDGTPAAKSAANDDWLRPAISEAKAAKNHGFRVTRLTIDPAGTRVSVETRFVAGNQLRQLADGLESGRQ